MIKKIAIPYFPMGLKYATPFIFGIAIYFMLLKYWTVAIILIVVTFIILTTNYVTKIDLHQKYCTDYLSILGIRLNQVKKSFGVLDRIVITKGNYSQTINTRVQSRQMNWADYTATLIFDEGDSLELLTKTDKSELIKIMKEFNVFLKVGLEDRTTSQYYWIET